MKRYWKIHRVLATGASFAVFMTLGLALGSLFLPIASFFERNVKKRTRLLMDWVRYFWRFHINFMTTTKAFGEISFKGLDTFKQNSPCILLANHPSLIDVVAIGSRVENLNCVVKKSLVQHRFFGGVIRKVNFIPNTAAVEMLRQAAVCFEDQRPLLVFPEGTRSQGYFPGSFKRGAAQMALRLNVPIVPIVITCTPPTLQKGVPWYVVPDEHPALRLHFMPPITVPESVNQEESTAAKARVFTAYLEDYFKQELQKRL